MSCLFFLCVQWGSASHFIAVFSELFLPKSVNFTFLCLKFSSPLCTRGEREEVNKQVMVWGVSVRILNWEIPFLNHNNYIKILCKS